MNINYAFLIKKTMLNKNTFSFILKPHNFTFNLTPGQFVNILVEDLTLRRPFSVCEVKEYEFRIVFKVCGKGTTKMSRWEPGRKINIMGPLGKGFKKLNATDKILLIGGGIGLAPLLELSKQSTFCSTLAGFNTKEEIILYDEFKKYGELYVCTKDGSFGNKGLVTDFIIEKIEKFKINRIAACGPEKMLEKVATIAKKEKIFCEISLEEQIECGFGACLGCKHIFKLNNTEKSLHVCKDGPVFAIWKKRYIIFY